MYYINLNTAILLEAWYQMECGELEEGTFDRYQWLQATLFMIVNDRFGWRK